MSSHILIVDDEMPIRRLIRVATERSGFSTEEVGTAAAALQALHRSKPRLVLLDLGLPDRDGMELIGAFRTRGVPIIVLTAREGSNEKVAALDLGADDYVTKPFDSEELMARIRSCLRRADSSQGIARQIQIASLEIDIGSHSVRKSDVEVKLTPKEFALLVELAGHAGKVLTHTHLLREIWGPAHIKDVEYLRVIVRSLRKKIEDDPSGPTLILNEPGVGYRLKDARDSTKINTVSPSL
ncbi:Response regulator consisting of a CheY-like receiver domain and a winged-helix DNA-binding domain [Fulvimarina pelagi HTCC2506]|uniref:Response regulator consisting of a CheY-like receiver domain and a winged-helix DNA-binding domain n=2 Tax=Fulvimarina pelagi TaxID=217511 RepID=Q0G2W8_9HYPH|nr:response regulator transcription factor [Fulvimarina pelagi]EAU42063.1 Response regulator consisting of a CheY-like receiver domain and a winged-helix DNA-binding domain [Fulvimarina pelagi HTCC2506]BAT31031.1 response regulator consisting of a CheY-like receiver domain and a winged-helix DNA-binding domain [Fulvimarina pelagi]